MAERASLRDYQRSLSARLRAAETAQSASRLGVQVGGEAWLVDLVDAGEIIPVPPITSVPLTRHWFTGLANIRGNLYSVVDFSAFLGGRPVTLAEEARLLLVAERHRMATALLVDRSLGLRAPAQLQLRANGSIAAPWIKAEYSSADGAVWKELDVPELVRDPRFLDVTA